MFRDTVLVFDPTNQQLVNIVPHCSQIMSVLALFRGAWKQIEHIFETAIEVCKNKSSDDESFSGVVEEVAGRLMQKEEGFLLGLFGLSGCQLPQFN